MKTIQLHASQLPIEQTATRAVWRFEIDSLDIDLIVETGKRARFEVSEQPETEADFERDLTVEMEPSAIIAKIQGAKHHGDLYDPITNKFLGFLVR